MKSFLRSEWITLWIILFSLCAQAHERPWELIKEESGIEIYRREVVGSPVLAFKGESLIDASIEQIAGVIFDSKNAPQWVADLAEARIVRWLGPDEFIEYDHFKTPSWITSDRDFVSRVKIEVDPKTHVVTFRYRSVTDPSLPETRYVRGELIGSVFRLEPRDGGRQTYLTGEIHCDPKGAIPKWLANWAQKGWPLKTIKNLRARVAQSKTQADPRILELLTGKPRL